MCACVCLYLQNPKEILFSRSFPTFSYSLTLSPSLGFCFFLFFEKYFILVVARHSDNFSISITCQLWESKRTEQTIDRQTEWTKERNQMGMSDGRGRHQSNAYFQLVDYVIQLHRKYTQWCFHFNIYTKIYTFTRTHARKHTPHCNVCVVLMTHSLSLSMKERRKQKSLEKALVKCTHMKNWKNIFSNTRSSALI